MLAGYKTYIAAGLALVNYLAHYLTGEITVAELINSALPYIVAIFMRQGISKAAS